MNNPLAFLLTFRTYGTWLHGDTRGAVDDTHNIPGTPLLPTDDERLDYETAILRQEPMVFTDAMRSVVDAAFADECSYRGWELLARSVRTNHVHVVIVNVGLDPDRMIQKIKSRATRWLRERGLIARDRLVWADRPGSRRYLWKPEQIQAACIYVMEGQGQPR